MSRTQSNHARPSATRLVSRMIRLSAAAGLLALATSAGSAQATGYTIGTIAMPGNCGAGIERGYVRVINTCGAGQNGHIHWETAAMTVQRGPYFFPIGTSLFSFDAGAGDDLVEAVVDITSTPPNNTCITAEYADQQCL